MNRLTRAMYLRGERRQARESEGRRRADREAKATISTAIDVVEKARWLCSFVAEEPKLAEVTRQAMYRTAVAIGLYESTLRGSSPLPESARAAGGNTDDVRSGYDLLPNPSVASSTRMVRAGELPLHEKAGAEGDS